MASLARTFPVGPALHDASSRAAAGYRLESAAFTHAVIALCAKVATIDGPANPAEYATFHALFVARATIDNAHARSLFVRRANDDSSALQYARQIAAISAGDTAMHRDLLQRLFKVALADASINAAELELLRAVGDVFGIQKDVFRSQVQASMGGNAASPYEILGSSPRATDKELRDHYMARVQKLHPDRYQAAGASAETIALLSDQLAMINAAYASVQQARAKKPSKAAGVTGWLSRKHTKGASTASV